MGFKLRLKIKIPKILKGPGKWLGKVAKAAGSVAFAPMTLTAKAGRATLGKIPIAGGAFNAAFSLGEGPAKLSESIMSGTRLDKAALGNLKESCANVRVVGPYVQAICSIIPGIGMVAATAIGAGIAAAGVVAGGMSITDALKETAIGAVPGGAAARLACSFAIQAAEGKNLGKALVDSALAQVPGGAASQIAINVAKAGIQGKNLAKSAMDSAISQLPKDAQTAIVLTQRLVRGDNMAKALLEQVSEKLPKDLRNAIAIGATLGVAGSIQKQVEGKIVGLANANLSKFASVGKAFLAKSPVLAAGQKFVTAKQSQGYLIGANLMSKSGINERTIMLMRKKLAPDAQAGYDTALSMMAGMASGKAPAKNMTPTAVAAYYTTVGLEGSGASQRTPILTAMKANAEARIGMSEGIQALPNTPLWKKILQKLGLGK